MRLTPLDIKRQEFKRTMRGCDPVEVETFLEMVANEYESLLKENEQLRTEALTLRTQLKDFQQVEQTLKETLMNAQDSINRARINTEKEANLIIHEAELRAEKVLDKVRRDVDKMKNELALIRSQKESFASRLRHLLEAQIELIKVLEIDDADLKDSDLKPPRRKKEMHKPVIQEELPLTPEREVEIAAPFPEEYAEIAEAPAEEEEKIAEVSPEEHEEVREVPSEDEESTAEAPTEKREEIAETPTEEKDEIDESPSEKREEVAEAPSDEDQMVF
ncbi:MAG: DivIVA domain-containing protein [bacterium]